MQKPVVVLGGGPAGAVAALLLARHGLKVQLLERSRFPRHHVGESLQPATFSLLDQHFGLGPLFAQQGFARKYGAMYVWGESRAPWTVLFDERLERDLPTLDNKKLLEGPYEHAWQVERSRFDQLLLEEAAKAGVEVREDCHAEGALLEEDQVVGVRTASEKLPAAWVIDATGQQSLLGHQFGLLEPVEDLRATATYAYYEGAEGVPGPLGRHVQLVVSLDCGWAWFIPISASRTSVGIVSRDRRPLSPEAFEAALSQAGAPFGSGRRLQGEGHPFRFARDWSYRARFCTGKGWTLVGDAACFVDPVLSGGVDFAIRGALNAAVGVLSTLDGTRPEALNLYGSRLAAEYAAYLRMARYWYGNNRSVQGFFWEAHKEIPPESASTPLRAFVYLTSGRIAAERHLQIFQEWQEARLYRQLGVDRTALKRSLESRK